MPDRRTSPQLVLPTFTLPNAVPGTAQWTSKIPDGGVGSFYIRNLRLTCISAASVSLHLVPPGGATATTNLILAALPMTAGQMFDIYNEDKEAPLPGGYSLFFFASAANAINATLWGEYI